MKRSRQTEIDWRRHSGQPSLIISDSKGVTIRLQALQYTPYMLQIFENGDIWARNSDSLTIGPQFNHYVAGDAELYEVTCVEIPKTSDLLMIHHMEDLYIRRWDLAKGQISKPIALTLPDDVDQFKFQMTPDGAELAIWFIGEDPHLWLWNYKTSEKRVVSLPEFSDADLEREIDFVWSKPEGPLWKEGNEVQLCLLLWERCTEEKLFVLQEETLVAVKIDTSPVGEVIWPSIEDKVMRRNVFSPGPQTSTVTCHNLYSGETYLKLRIRHENTILKQRKPSKRHNYDEIQLGAGSRESIPYTVLGNHRIVKWHAPDLEIYQP